LADFSRSVKNIAKDLFLKFSISLLLCICRAELLHKIVNYMKLSKLLFHMLQFFQKVFLLWFKEFAVLDQIAKLLKFSHFFLKISKFSHFFNLKIFDIFWKSQKFDIFFENLKIFTFFFENIKIFTFFFNFRMFYNNLRNVKILWKTKIFHKWT